MDWAEIVPFIAVLGVLGAMWWRLNSRIDTLDAKFDAKFDTLHEILQFLEARGSGLNREQSTEANAKLQALVTQAEKRIRDLEPGYQARRGQQVMQEFSKLQRN